MRDDGDRKSPTRWFRSLSPHRRSAIAVGVPALLASLLAVALGLPWWVVLAALLLVGLLIVFEF